MYSTIAVIHNSIVVQHLRSSEALRASAWTVEAAVRIWLRSSFSASSYRCPCWRIEECSASALRPVAVPAPALRVASCDAPPASEEEGLRLDSSTVPQSSKKAKIQFVSQNGDFTPTERKRVHNSIWWAPLLFVNSNLSIWRCDSPQIWNKLNIL